VIRLLQQHLSLANHHPDRDRQFSQDTLVYCKEYQESLLQIKVVHPKCGAGVFLATALEFLIAEHERIHYLLTKFSPNAEAIAHKTPSEIIAHILQHNLYGCDVTEESVEITRLSLCLRSLEINPSLPNFEHNIQLGELASCDFGEEFKEASDRGKVVILK
jgi:type I restriction-modification system DNA methylase subunit